ncbi:MAG: lysophospholipid acyltransferase family protein [Cyclobacteriaceae bacterium]
MTRLLKKTYAIYAGILYVVSFIPLFIPIVFFGSFKKTKFIAHRINVFTSFFTFFFTPIIYKREYRFKPSKKEQYVYCSNHTSFMDIPLLFLTLPGFVNIMGKSTIGSWPLFGIMYKQLYILVNRKSKTGRFQALQDAKDTVADGRSMIIFPEGTIPNENAPNMINFKDGAFKVAIANQIPIIPITIPFNWKKLPGIGAKEGLSLGKVKIIVHEPIVTKGMTESDVRGLKDQTFNIIDSELKKQNNI